MKKSLSFVWAYALVMLCLVSTSCSNQQAERTYDTSMQYAIDIYNQGVEYTNAQEHEKAVECYRIAAEYYGLDQAQFNLGRAYYNGDGVEQDFTKAATLYYQAAQQGHPEGQFAIALCYLSEIGVAQDNERFIYWCQQAADQGFADAQIFMSVCYLTGFEVEPSISESFLLFCKAIRQGDIVKRLKNVGTAFMLVLIYK